MEFFKTWHEYCSDKSNRHSCLAGYWSLDFVTLWSNIIQLLSSELSYNSATVTFQEKISNAILSLVILSPPKCVSNSTTSDIGTSKHHSSTPSQPSRPKFVSYVRPKIRPSDLPPPRKQQIQPRPGSGKPCRVHGEIGEVQIGAEEKHGWKDHGERSKGPRMERCYEGSKKHWRQGGAAPICCI